MRTTEQYDWATPRWDLATQHPMFQHYLATALRVTLTHSPKPTTREKWNDLFESLADGFLKIYNDGSAPL